MQWKNRHKRTKFVSVLLILVLLMANSVSSILADEISGTGEAYAIPASELSEETEAQNQTAGQANNVSGVLWLDENNDGNYDEEEALVSDYPVYLYGEGNLTDEIQKVTTNKVGKYEFSELEPGEYIVGIKAKENDTGYILPVAEVTDDTDNKFTVDAELLTEAYSKIIVIAEDSIVIDLSCGMGQAAEQIENSNDTDADNVINNDSKDDTESNDSVIEDTGRETAQTDNAEDNDLKIEDSMTEGSTTGKEPETDSDQSLDYSLSLSELETDTNSISGTIWLDANEDGVYDSDEKPVADYEVSLYLASDKTNAVSTAITNADGKYTFADIVPGDYVAGIPLSQEVSGIEYLVPLVGISGDNKFILDYSALDENAETGTQNIYTEVMSMASDSQVGDVSGGVRSVPSIQPTAQVTYTYNNIRYTLDTVALTGTVSGYTGGRAYVTIPAVVVYNSKSYAITAIGDSAFSGATITGVDIGSNVTSIGTYAFRNCTSMTGTLTVPDNVLTIANYAFYGCTNLQLNYDSFIELVKVDVDTSELGVERKLPSDEAIEALEKELEDDYEDTKDGTYKSVSGKSDSYVYKSATADEIEINYAKARPGDFDFVFVIDESASMQAPAATTLGGTTYSYPRYTYSHQILDQVTEQLLDASLNNRVAIAGFGASLQWSTASSLASSDSGFSSGYTGVTDALWENLNLQSASTNYASGLQEAIDMINNRTDTTRIPVVIFISDGEPNAGDSLNSVYGGRQAQTLRSMNVPVFPVSIFLSDSQVAKASAALTAISYDSNTYYEARDADSFQDIIVEVINAATSMTETITDELSEYFELSTGTDADLYTESGTAYVDNDGSIVWNLSGCEYGVNHTLKIKIKYTDEVVVGDLDDYETNEKLTVPDITIDSPEIPLGLESAKTVTDAGGNGMASAGEVLTYTIEATNTGTGDWVNELVQDTLSDLLPYIQEKNNLSSVALTVDNDGTVTKDKTLQDLVKGFRIDLAVGKTIKIEFNVTCVNSLDSKTVTELVNTAAVGDTTPSADIPVGSTGSITINKLGNNGKSLPGAIFLLEKQETNGAAWAAIKWNSTSQTWEEDTAKAGISTGSGGEIVFANLPLDTTYRITEIGAPDGYLLLKEPIEVTLPYEIRQSSSEPAPADYDYYKDNGNGTISYYYYDITYTVTDSSVLQLPNAGIDVTSLVYILAGAGIALLGAGMYIIYRRRRAMIDP